MLDDGGLNNMTDHAQADLYRALCIVNDVSERERLAA